MRKKLLITFCVISVIVVLIQVGACFSKKEHWIISQEITSVKEIKIIEATNAYEYEIIAEIDIALAKELYTDIESLEMKKYGFTLSHPYDRCFLIVFENGEYDIISKRESSRFKYEDGELRCFNSWLMVHSEKDFDAMIEKYLKKTGDGTLS